MVDDEPIDEYEDETSAFPQASEEAQALVRGLEANIAKFSALKDVEDVNDPRLDELKNIIKAIGEKFTEEIGVEIPEIHTDLSDEED